MTRLLNKLKSRIVKNDRIYFFLKFSQFPIMKLIRFVIRKKNNSKRFNEYSKNIPLSIGIETTSICNTHCIFCPHKNMKRSKMHMPNHIFEKAVSECIKSGVNQVALNFMGEPLLDLNIFDRIRYLKENNIRVVFSTNGMLLTKENSKKLLESGIDEITISLDACSENTYKYIRSNGNFKKTIDQINYFLDLRKNGKYKTSVKIGMMCMDESKSEISKFLKYWEDKVDDACVRRMHTWANDKNQKNILKNALPCSFLWNGLTILSNGDVTVCCFDYEGVLSLGNIMSTPLKKLWNNKKIRYLRRMHLTNNRSKLPLCSTCDLEKSTIDHWWYYK